MTMLERVARAIAEGRGVGEAQWKHFLPSALAAVKAMRLERYEPLLFSAKGVGPDVAYDVWTAMLDAILAAQPQEQER